MELDPKTVALGASILYSIGCEIINFSPTLKSSSILEVVLNVLKVVSKSKDCPSNDETPK